MNSLVNFDLFYAVFSRICWWSSLAEIVRKFAYRLGDSSILRNLRLQNAALNRMKNLRSFEDKFTRTTIQKYTISESFRHPKSIQSGIVEVIKNELSIGSSWNRFLINFWTILAPFWDPFWSSLGHFGLHNGAFFSMFPPHPKKAPPKWSSTIFGPFCVSGGPWNGLWDPWWSPVRRDPWKCRF